MTLYLNEMRHFMEMAEDLRQGLKESILEVPVEEATSFDQNTEILEDLQDMAFKLQSYQESSRDPSYAKGIEEGMSLAADMITRLIERHSGL